jgi:hypothetical protein
MHVLFSQRGQDVDSRSSPNVLQTKSAPRPVNVAQRHAGTASLAENWKRKVGPAIAA